MLTFFHDYPEAPAFNDENRYYGNKKNDAA